MSNSEQLTAKEAIEQGNRLIAEFMGLKIGIDKYSWRPGCVDPLEEKHLNYHDSWGWLMPVVEKINATGEYDVIIFRTTCHINDKDSILFETDYRTSLKGLLVASVYEVVVKFVQWHNSQKQTNL